MQRGEVEDLEVHAEVVAGGGPVGSGTGVPRLRPPQVVELLENGDDVGEVRCAGPVVHRASNTSAIRRTTTAGV